MAATSPPSPPPLFGFRRPPSVFVPREGRICCTSPARRGRWPATWGAWGSSRAAWPRPPGHGPRPPRCPTGLGRCHPPVATRPPPNNNKEDNNEVLHLNQSSEHVPAEYGHSLLQYCTRSHPFNIPAAKGELAARRVAARSLLTL